MTNANEVLTERVIIEGEDSRRVRFEFQVVVNINLNEGTPEQALLKALGSEAVDFKEYVSSQGWLRADWSYTNVEESKQLFVVQ